MLCKISLLMEFNCKRQQTNQLVLLWRDIFNIGMHASRIKKSYMFPDFHFEFTHKYRISFDKRPRR